MAHSREIVDIPACSNSGVGHVVNAEYGQDVPTHQHSFMHETTNYSKGGVQLYALFCEYSHNKFLAKFIKNKTVFELYNEIETRAIDIHSHSEEILERLSKLLRAITIAYNNERNSLLNMRFLYEEKLQQDQNDDFAQQKLTNINRQLNAGTTALLVITVENKLFVFNCGDSRALLLSDKDGEELTCEKLCSEHNITNIQENERLRGLGIDPGEITGTTRCIGDCCSQFFHNRHEENNYMSDEYEAFSLEVDVLSAFIREEHAYIVIFSDSVARMIEEIGVDANDVDQHLSNLLHQERTSGRSTSNTSIAQGSMSVEESDLTELPSSVDAYVNLNQSHSDELVSKLTSILESPRN